MGLDMYLDREYYLGSSTNKNEDLITFDCFGGKLEVDKNKIKSFQMEIGYWRKANAIHSWFVKHIQDGKDDCGVYQVSNEKMMELYDECSKAYLKKDPKEFQPKEGFFFGGTEIDQWYWQDIFNTIKMLDPIIKELKKPYEDRDALTKGSDFYYRSSW